MFIPLSDKNALKHISLQYVTLTIIAANILIWVVYGTPAFFAKEAATAAAYSYGYIPAVVNGYQTLPIDLDKVPETLTYFSYAFFHGDFMHMAGNMLFIWVFGDNVEDAMGHFKFLIFFFACAAIAAFSHGLTDPQSPVPLIGASGAAAGIIGAYLILHPKVKVWVLALGRIPLRIPAWFVLTAWIGFQTFMLITDPNGLVSWAAHVGGFIAGIILLFVFKRSDTPIFDRDISRITPTPEQTQQQNSIPASIPKEEKIIRDKPVKKSTGPKIKWGRHKSD